MTKYQVLGQKPFSITDGELYLIAVDKFVPSIDPAQPNPRVNLLRSLTYIQMLSADQLKTPVVLTTANMDGEITTRTETQKPYSTYSTPDNATVFQYDYEAQAVMEQIRDHVPMNLGLFLMQVKDCAEIYYFVEMPYNKEKLTIGKKWSYKNRRRSLLDNNQFFPLNEFNQFQETLKEYKLEVINTLHQKILDVHTLNPFNL